uniref:C-type lectin domain-containing protein n=1 Tax=Plectus sambesii TaxID=2011161 RepID=A0A914XPU9_9BILA
MNWTYYAKTNKCFRIYGGTGGTAYGNSLNWGEAEETCNRYHGGHLASFHSEDELLFAVALAQEYAAHDDGGDAPVWIGLCYSLTFDWMYTDISSATYFRWWYGYDRDGTNFPSGYLCTKRKRTGYMGSADGSEIWPFICQTPPASNSG